jgi:hypothetical protein
MYRCRILCKKFKYFNETGKYIQVSPKKKTSPELPYLSQDCNYIFIHQIKWL